MRVHFLLLVLFALATTAKAESSLIVQPFNGSTVWQNYAMMPQYEPWQWMYEDALDIAHDLNNNGGQYYLEYKSRGGSSHQTLVRRTADDGIMGIWSAPNHATYILGEIFAFHIARILERSHWVTPGVRMTLVGPGREMAYQAMNVELTGGMKSRSCNRDTILAHMDQNPHYITGAYMAFLPGQKPEAVPDLVDRQHRFRLNRNHFLVQMLYKDGPRPQNRIVYLNEVGRNFEISLSPVKPVATSTDTELAKQLSFLTLVDALNSQRDRFGPYGSNMEVMLDEDNGSFAITAVDNGGIADSHKTSSFRFFLGTSRNDQPKPVSRFEKQVADQVIAMDDFVKGRSSHFLGFSTVDELMLALGYEQTTTQDIPVDKPRSCRSNHAWLMYSLKTRWDKRMSAFKKALSGVAHHLRSLQYESNSYFD